MKPLRSAMILGLLVGMQGASSLAQVPKPDPLQGDGRVSEFYTWSGELSGPPGRLLRREPLPGTLGLANAASQERILYTSTDGVEGKSLITVSGALFIPTARPLKKAGPCWLGRMARLGSPIFVRHHGKLGPIAMFGTSTSGSRKALRLSRLTIKD